MVVVPGLGAFRSVTTTVCVPKVDDMGVSTVIQRRAPLTGTNIGTTMIDGYDNHSELPSRVQLAASRDHLILHLYGFPVRHDRGSECYCFLA